MVGPILGVISPFQPMSEKAHLSDGSKDDFAGLSCGVRHVKRDFILPNQLGR